MNRKERRASGRRGSLPKLPIAAGPAAGDRALAELFGAAVAYQQAGALNQAERGYRHILALYPSHANSLHNLGLIALHRGDAATSADLIGKAIALDGRVAEYHYNAALAFRALNRMNDVEAHLQRTIDLRRDHALAHLNLGNVRREQGRWADAIDCYERTLALSPNSPAAHFNLANVFSGQGRWHAALEHYRRALAFDPRNAEAQYRLAVALCAVGDTGEAISHFEAALAVNPRLRGAHDALGKAYLSLGKTDLAIHAAARAVELDETPQAKRLFAQCAALVRFTADNGGRFRRLTLRAIKEDWARPRALSGACISLIKLDSAVSDAIARAGSAWPERLPAAQVLPALEADALARDDLLKILLECDPVTDVDFERFLTSARLAMLTESAADGAPDENQLGLSCAIARQCFVNEYVFSLLDDESVQAERLRQMLEQALAAGESCPPHWLAGVGAYFPLHTLANATALLDRPWPDCVKALLVQQIAEPMQERRIAANIPVITELDGDVTREVRRQYEESPYPRWVRSGLAERPPVLGDREPKQLVDVLIAGCGTGLSTVEFARHADAARILAVDLSRASLSYAKRMADEIGLDNVEFAQADIMRLSAIGRSFDFIDCSGVLHHLADLWAGWRILVSLLRPGGAMQVGLYSELARRNIVAARAWIAERGFQPTPQDIRRCRESILAAGDPVLKSVVQWEDFFTTGECRDLLFHVQEHRTSLPEIKSFLAENGVQFAGFNLGAPVLHRFVTRFPDSAAVADLDCWHAFETEAPNTFANMYQFWVRKPAAS